jgi:hypothetical protein
MTIDPLAAEYRLMAADEEQEREALAWWEALAADACADDHPPFWLDPPDYRCS